MRRRKVRFKLAELGFRVKELIGGIEWWKRDGYAIGARASSTGNQDNLNLISRRLRGHGQTHRF